jgi:Zn-finger nucleic acid-binding protein
MPCSGLGNNRMRKCPVCRVDLVPLDYEGVRLHHCPDCRGYLVAADRLKCIERGDRTSIDKLKAEATEEFGASSGDVLQCPRCRLRMRKQSLGLPVLDLDCDICSACDLVWLDGGELAMLQLSYQAGSKFINAQEMKRRFAELEASPGRKAEFEANMARLKDLEDVFDAMAGRVGAVLWEILTRRAG